MKEYRGVKETQLSGEKALFITLETPVQSSGFAGNYIKYNETTNSTGPFLGTILVHTFIHIKINKCKYKY